jgi:AmmeMemoRadiSam system protein B
MNPSQNHSPQRTPAVAGKFYPENSVELEKKIAGHLGDLSKNKRKAIGVVSPHAGLIYSGDVAGAVYSRIEIPETVILLGPNHTGQGDTISVMTKGLWSMPMGDIAIDEELATLLCKETPIAKPNFSAHQFEHSLETQLPFLQYLKKSFRIVPICLKKVDFSICKKLSEGIVKALEQTEKSVLIIASSDMTHFESHKVAKEKDIKAIAKIENRDALGLYETVQQEQISMCGVNPVTVMLLCCEKRGAQKAELIEYKTSGEVNGDKNRVVGYAGVIVT